MSTVTILTTELSQINANLFMLKKELEKILNQLKFVKPGIEIPLGSNLS